MATDLAEVTPDGKLRLNFHRGQAQAWRSTKRFIGVIAGTQGGKTSFGPHWLYREIQSRGPGDYMVVTPTFALLEKKALPEFLKVFKRWLKLGTYVASPVRKFTFSEEGSLRTFGHYDPEQPTVVFFGYAEDPESLESATAKAAWLDEAGQKKFKLGSWEAILRRLSIAQGRALITTTPYDLGWLKQQIYDRWKRGQNPETAQKGDEDFDVVRFDSTENPQFSQEEFARAKRDLPPWKFNLFYRGIFTRPAGQIYDSFIDEYEPEGHKGKIRDIPFDWKRYLGLDFGGVNTAGLFYAENPETKKLVLYREYKAGGRTAAEHVTHLKKGEPPITMCVGGSQSEGQWRNEFRAAGLIVLEPDISDVEVGINRVYGCHARGEVVVLDLCSGYLEQKGTYSRKLDDKGEPTEEIEHKATFHFMDAERYILGKLRPSKTKRAWNFG